MDNDTLTLKVTLEKDTSKEIQGLTINENQIIGQLNIEDWKDDEETRDIKLTVKLTPVSSSQQQPIVKESVITVQRDTDGDGDPDITDEDDDNDGIPDVKDTDKRKYNELAITPEKELTVKQGEEIAALTKAITSNKPSTTFSSNEISGVKVDENGYLVGRPNITDWKDGEKEKTITISVTATSSKTGKNKEDETKESTVIVNVIRDDKSAYTPKANTINKKYGEATTEEDIKNAITIAGLKDEDKSKIGYEFDKTKLPDGTKAGNHTVTVSITYPYQTKSEQITVTVDVAKKVRTLALTPETQDVIEYKAINPITINAEKLASDVISLDVKDAKNDNVSGLSINSENKITGTPSITNWESQEEQREITVTVKLTKNDGSESTTSVEKNQPRMQQ